MKKTENNSLFLLIHDYLKIYLPKQRCVSTNTVRSYREALGLFLDYVKDKKKVSLSDITFEMLTKEIVMQFLDYLEEERGCMLSTRNNRLNILRSFATYASDRDITAVVFLDILKEIPLKKGQVVSVVDYMSMKAVSAIVEQTDPSTPKGLRDRVFLIVLYDTGARIQEMIDIKLCDLHMDKFPKITLHGKGNKTRVVPLMEKTVKHLKKYLFEFHRCADLSSEIPLFYSTTNGRIHPISDRRIRDIIKKYSQMARGVCQEVPENVFPHMFRHSRAMHLYQGGMDLMLVSQWLGHSHIETTKIYAHADTEHKRKAIAAATPKDNPLYAKLNSDRYTLSDDETLKRLAGLR